VEAGAILAARRAAWLAALGTAALGPAAVLAGPTETSTTPIAADGPPLTAEELALVEALTRPPPRPAWPAGESAGLPFARVVPARRLTEPLAPTVEGAFRSLPIPVLDFADRPLRRDRYVGPHFVEPALRGWLETDPWLWGEVVLEDLGDERGGAVPQIRLAPRRPPESDGAEVRAGAALSSANRGLRGLAGAGARTGPWGLRLDASMAGGDDVRLPSGDARPDPRLVGGVAGSGWWGGRAKDPGHLRLVARADLRGEAPVPAGGDRASLTRVLVGADGRLRWGDAGSIVAAGSYQRASQLDDRWALQGRLRIETPRAGPFFALAHGLVSAGEGAPGDFARREAGAELGAEAGPARVSTGPLVSNQVDGADEITEVGWSGRLAVDLPAGVYLAAETRRGRDLFARRPGPSGGFLPDDARTHVVVAGPGVRAGRGWARVQAVGRWRDEDDRRLPVWSARADGAFGVWRGLSVAGALSVRPNLALHLSARYAADFGFLEVHGRGQTESFEPDFADTPGGFAVGFMSGVELGAGFGLALAVENATDASVGDVDRGVQPGIDGRVLLSYRGPRVRAPRGSAQRAVWPTSPSPVVSTATSMRRPAAEAMRSDQR
jgi:hypothetical protein